MTDRPRPSLEELRLEVEHVTLRATWAEAAPRLRVAAKPQISLVSEELRRQAGTGPSHVYVAMITPHLSPIAGYPPRGPAARMNG